MKIVYARLLLFLTLATSFSACGGGSSNPPADPPPPPPPSSAAPTITSISPDPVVGLEHRQEIVITGTGFKANLTVTLTWTNQPGFELPSEHVTLISESEVEIRIRTTLEADSWTVRVTNGDGQSSNEYAFAVEAPVIALVDGFDYPLGDSERYTEDNDGDDWYTFVKFNEERKDENDIPTGKWHTGEDWNAEGDPNPNDEYGETSPDRDLGQPVYAIANGTIVKAGAADVPGWGTVLIVRHRMPNDALVESVYGHVKDIVKTKGDVVRGEQIASIGKGGIGLDAHLHLEVRFCNSDGICGNETGDSPNELFGHDTTQSPHGWTDPSEFIDAHRPSLTIVDGDFTNWSQFSAVIDDPLIATPGPGTSTGTATTMATGGNPDAYLATTAEIFAGDILTTGAIKDDYQLCNAGSGPDFLRGSYDPADGAINRLILRVDGAILNVGESTLQLVVEQGDTKYYSWVPFGLIGDWVTKESWFVREDFHTSPIRLQGELFNMPDFSVNGQELKFGLAVGNAFGGGAGISEQGLDNFSLTIARSVMFDDVLECPRTAQPN